jgi:hypothetical protein
MFRFTQGEYYGTHRVKLGGGYFLIFTLQHCLRLGPVFKYHKIASLKLNAVWSS